MNYIPIEILVGYMISWIFDYCNIPWMSAVWFLAFEILLILYMRDSVILFFNVFVKNKTIIQWQLDGVKIAKAKQNKNLSIVWPLSGFLKVEDMEGMEYNYEQVPIIADDSDDIP